MKERKIRLTASEIGSLWSSYMAESGSIPMLKFFLEKVEDEEIKTFIELALNFSKKHLIELENIMKQEEYPVPIGFSKEDVNLNAPRLFSDTYVLYFLRNLGKAGIAANGAAVTSAAREDMRILYRNYLNDTILVEDEAKRILLSKGLFVRPPHIPTPKKVEFVNNQNFLKGWFGERRPLIADEITHLYMNYTNNLYGRSLLIGFAQVSPNPKIRKYFERGIDLSREILDVIKIIFEESNLPAPMTWDAEVSDFIVSPFSDKLMLFQTSVLTALSLGNIGGSIALSLRRDISAKYLKQMMKVGLYAEDGAELMIENGWLEQPPISADRKELINQNK
jgi:hypothetical protein